MRTHMLKRPVLTTIGAGTLVLASSGVAFAHGAGGAGGGGYGGGAGYGGPGGHGDPGGSGDVGGYDPGGYDPGGYGGAGQGVSQQAPPPQSPPGPGHSGPQRPPSSVVPSTTGVPDAPVSHRASSVMLQPAIATLYSPKPSTSTSTSTSPRSAPQAVLEAFFCQLAGPVESSVTSKLAAISAKLAKLSTDESDTTAAGDTILAREIQSRINRLDREQARLKAFLSNIESTCEAVPASS